MGIIKRIWAAIRNQMDIDIFQAQLAIECEHSSLEPCADCENQARADRW